MLDKIYYKNEDIVDIIIDGNIQPSDGFMIGATTSQLMELTLLNKGDIIYGTSTIKLEIGLKIGDTIEYIPMGIYNIDDIVKTDYTIKITAYDNMIKFEKNFTTDLGDNLTLQQVVSELTRITGVEFIGSLPAYTVKKLEGFSCREILGYVASLCGGNAVITRDGKFTIVIPKDINYSIGTANYFDYKREETKYKIGKISCQAGEMILSKGSLGTDSMELEFENPWVTDSILQDIYNNLKGFEYLGYSMKWQGDLSLDLGDIVTITDKNGVVRKHPILSQKFTYTGGLTSEIGAKGETKNKNSFSSSGSTAKKVERAIMELAIINKALIDVAYIGDLTAGNIKFDTASGNIMDLQTLISKFVSGENGQFLNLTTDNVTISNAVIKDIIAKNISVEDLKAGRISTTKFTIASDDGGIQIVGATQQFKDKNNKVRIQMGQDTQGNFNFILRGEDGTTTLIDHTGIKEKAIADDLIKSNMVAADAIGEKQINYSSLITGLNKDNNTSLIKASKVAIDLTGQSLEVSFNSLKSNVDNIQIGGRNLLTTSNMEYSPRLINSISATSGLKIELYPNNNSFKITSITSSSENYYRFMNPNHNNLHGLEAGEYYTISGYIRGNNLGGRFAYRSESSDGSTWRYSNHLEDLKIDSEDTFSYFKFTTKIPVGSKGHYVSFQFYEPVVGGWVEFKNVKFEKGNKATDYTVAPEDIDYKIESNTTAITVAQGKIEGLISENTIIKGDVTTISDKYTSLKSTVDGINTTVASHTSSIGGLNDKVTTVENNYASLSQSLEGFKTTVSNTYSTKTELNGVNNRFNEYSTTSQMNTAITQSANSIKNEVNNTFLSKGDATNIYATKASMELTANQLKLDFSSSGGMNLVKDGQFKSWDFNNGKWWWFDSNLRIYGRGTVEGTGIGFYSEDGNVARLCSNYLNFKSNTTYTLRLDLFKEANVNWYDVYIEFKRGDGTNISTISCNTNGYTFTTPSGCEHGYIMLVHGGRSNAYEHYVLWVSDVALYEGNIQLPYSPHPDEVYEGNTTIDANGVTVNNGALTIKNKAGTTVFQGDSDGNLILSGTVKSQNGDMYVSLDSGGILFQDWNKREQLLRIATTNFSANKDMNGVTFGMPKYSDFLRFSYIEKEDLNNGWTDSDPQYHFMDFWTRDCTVGNARFNKGINVYSPIYTRSLIRLKGSTDYTSDIANFSWNNIPGLLGMCGDNGLFLGFRYGEEYHSRLVITEDSHPGTDDKIKSWGHWNCSGYVVHNATFRGSFVNSLANTYTRSYTETEAIMAEGKQVRVNFEDVQLINGQAILNIPKAYIGINSGYIINSIVKKGKGSIWVDSEEENRFIIKGENDIKINVEIIIKINEISSLAINEEEPLIVEMNQIGA